MTGRESRVENFDGGRHAPLAGVGIGIRGQRARRRRRNRIRSVLGLGHLRRGFAGDDYPGHEGRRSRDHLRPYRCRSPQYIPQEH